MNELIALNTRGTALAADLLRTWPRSTLPAVPGGRPRTVFVTRHNAGPIDMEALLACLSVLTGNSTAVLALCGGAAGPTFKVHPEGRTLRLQVNNEEIDTSLVDYRLEHSREHMIAIFDPNRNRNAVTAAKMLNEFGVPVDLIYVAARKETQMPFVAFCQAKGILPIIAEEKSAFTEQSADRLYFPAIPATLRDAFQSGEQTLFALLQSAKPAVLVSYLRSADAFVQQFRELCSAGGN